MKILQNIILIIILIVFAVNLSALEKAPDFKLENMEGKQVKLSGFLEKGLVVLDFWATWCEPCKKELTALNILQEKYGDTITVIAVSVDKARKKNKAKAFIKSRKYKFVTLFDVKSDVKKLYNITNIPRTLVITPDSEILFDHMGYKRGDEKHIEDIIKKWIKDKPVKIGEKIPENESQGEIDE